MVTVLRQMSPPSWIFPHPLLHGNPRTRWIVGHSLKKEDKGPRDPEGPKKTRKQRKKRRKRRRYRPEEINPFKQPISFSTPSPMDSQNEGSPQFDMESILGTKDLEEMFRRLNEIDEEDIVRRMKLGEDPKKPENKEEDVGEILNPPADIFDFEEGEPQAKASFDVEFDEEEAKLFLDTMQNMQPEDFLNKNRDFVKEIEQKILDRRTKGLMPPAEDQQRFANPFDQLCWDILNMYFPKRGKRDHRQNWDHINVSEEVKARRAAKKAKGYSIWLSMEISKVLKWSLVSISKLASNPTGMKKTVQSTLGKFSALVKFQEMKFSLRNATGMLQSIGLLAEKSRLQSCILSTYSSLIFSLLGMVEDHKSDLTGRCVSELLWTFEKLGPGLVGVKKSPEKELNIKDLISYVLEEAKSPKIKYSSQDLVISFRSVLLMDWLPSDEALVERLLNESINQMPSFNPYDISMMLNTCTKVSFQLPGELMEVLVDRSCQCAPDFSPQGMANTLHALARMKFKNCTRLIRNFVSEMERKLEDFEPQEISNVLWALSKLCYLPSPRFLDQVAAMSSKKMENFSLQGASNVLLSFGVFHHLHDGFIRSIKAKIVFHKGPIKTQDLVNVMWTLVMMDLMDTPFLECILQRLTKRELVEFHPAEKFQIYQCFLQWNLHHPHFSLLPKEFLEECGMEWREKQRKAQEEDPFYMEVVEFLQKAGYESEYHHQIHKDLFPISFVVHNGVNYVIEKLEDDLYFQNHPNQLVGRQRWKEALLFSYGYFMLRIKPEHWNRLTTEKQRLNFFKARI